MTPRTRPRKENNGIPQGGVSSHQCSKSPCNLETWASVSHLYRERSKSRWLVLCWNMHQNYLESCFQVTEAPASVLLPTPGKAPRKNSEVVNRANSAVSLPGWTTVPGDRSFHPHSQRGYKWNNHSSQIPLWRCINRNFFKRRVFVHPVVTQSSSSPSVVH